MVRVSHGGQILLISSRGDEDIGLKLWLGGNIYKKP